MFRLFWVVKSHNSSCNGMILQAPIIFILCTFIFYLEFDQFLTILFWCVLNCNGRWWSQNSHWYFWERALLNYCLECHKFLLFCLFKSVTSKSFQISYVLGLSFLDLLYLVFGIRHPDVLKHKSVPVFLEMCNFRCTLAEMCYCVIKPLALSHECSVCYTKILSHCPTKAIFHYSYVYASTAISIFMQIQSFYSRNANTGNCLNVYS